ncbi:unnamed protein product [Durusdinium trenchii]|uniref:Uncharacterized protein n=1 Tax=Durusdinium trenchii TaxID=1381693 RepID=A0ABP0NWQ9_9DINO
MAVKFGAHGFLRRDIQSPRLTWLFAGPKRPRLETVLFKGAQPWQCWGPATFSKLEGKLLLGTSNKAWPVSCQLCLASPSWMMMGLFGLKHHFSPSRLTNLAKNHRGCTPLMYSVLSSHFEATVALIALGADLGARNSQGKTAADLAREVLAPQELVTSLQGNDHDDTAPRTTTTGRKCESWPSKLAL